MSLEMFITNSQFDVEISNFSFRIATMMDRIDLNSTVKALSN